MLVSAPGLVVADVAGPDAVLPIVRGETPGGVVTEVSPLLPVPSAAIVPVTVVASVRARPSETKSDVNKRETISLHLYMTYNLLCRGGLPGIDLMRNLRRGPSHR